MKEIKLSTLYTQFSDSLVNATDGKLLAIRIVLTSLINCDLLDWNVRSLLRAVLVDQRVGILYRLLVEHKDSNKNLLDVISSIVEKEDIGFEVLNIIIKGKYPGRVSKHRTDKVQPFLNECHKHLHSLLKESSTFEAYLVADHKDFKTVR